MGYCWMGSNVNVMLVGVEMIVKMGCALRLFLNALCGSTHWATWVSERGRALSYGDTTHAWGKVMAFGGCC